MNNDNPKYEQLDTQREREEGARLKSDRSPEELKQALLSEYSQTVAGTASALDKTRRLADELHKVADYFGAVKEAAQTNYNYVDQHTAKEQFGIGEEKIKDMFNVRWQNEFNMFSISGFHFLIDSLSWQLWNWDFDEEVILDRHEDLQVMMETFINSNRYEVFDEDVPKAKLPLPQPVMSLWTEGSRMPASVKANANGYHHSQSPLGKDGRRQATWDELINPLVTWDNKNIQIVTPTYIEDDSYSIGSVAAMFDTTPFNVLKMLQEDLLRTDTEDTEYIAFEIKGSVLNNFINEMFEIKRLVKKERLDNYKEKMKSLHGGQKSLNL